MSLPVHVVSVPLQDPFDWQYLTLEPLKINPSSQLKETLLGNVVSRPVMEPFKGFERLPQSLAVKQKQVTCWYSFWKSPIPYHHDWAPMSYFTIHWLFVWNKVLPSQKLSVWLQVPLVWHFILARPRRIKPSSQLWMTKFGYTVFSPMTLPFRKGWGRPQSTAEMQYRRKQERYHKKYVFLE